MTAPQTQEDPANPASGELDFWRRRRALLPGMGLATVIAIAAGALAARYAAPAMLFALLLGMGLSFLSEDEAARPGLEFAASTLLKGAIALLGLSVSFDVVIGLGWGALAAVAAMTFGVIGLGLAIGHKLGWPRQTALVAAGAVAICGASAALALAAIMPSDRHPRSRTMAIIIGVTALSSISMVFYPVILEHLGFSDAQAGFVVGASIHDVAQVIGAGFSISPIAGETATLTKMIRVAMLPLALVLASLLTSSSSGGGRSLSIRTIRLPWFVAVFMAGVVIASLLPLPQALTEWVSEISRGAFFISISAIGLLSNPRQIVSAGSQTLKVLAVLSLFLFACSLALGVILEPGAP